MLAVRAVRAVSEDDAAPDDSARDDDAKTTTVDAALRALRGALESVENALQGEANQLVLGQAALLEEKLVLHRTVEVQRSDLEADYQQQCEEMQRGKDAFERRIVGIKAVNAVDEEVVHLNVGGVRFQTARRTLVAVEDSMLGAMFGRCSAMVRTDADGVVFIDRDGHIFGKVLALLRDFPGVEAAVASLNQLDEDMQQKLLRELDFFGLQATLLGFEAHNFAPLFPIEQAHFVQGPELASRRYGSAACMLDGARMIVVGGYDGYNFLVMACVWKPKTYVHTAEADGGALFAPGPQMLCRRYGCSCVDIGVSDRPVYVETPRPDRRSWRLDTPQVTPPVSAGRRILVVGSSTKTEILDVATMRFMPGPELLSRRSYCAVVALDDRRVLVCGGSDGSRRLFTTEVLDLETMTFAPGPKMGLGQRAVRYGCAAVKLDSNRVLVVGGDDKRTPMTEIFDVEKMAFSWGPTMLVRRYGCTAVKLDDRRVVVCGGNDGSRCLMTAGALGLGTMNLRLIRLAHGSGSCIIIVGGDVSQADAAPKRRGGTATTTEILTARRPRDDVPRPAALTRSASESSLPTTVAAAV
ncbi:hypothetical protein M885DRAFT_575984 [Pelagophyceae sp. CCMP2097]|nr:hypothetical protein M885DRAFT_575984 [Pelagophyceae sp. CCMP2097]